MLLILGTYLKLVLKLIRYIGDSARHRIFSTNDPSQYRSAQFKNIITDSLKQPFATVFRSKRPTERAQTTEQRAIERNRRYRDGI